MATITLEEATITFTEGNGYRLYRNVITDEASQSLYLNLTVETLFFVFGEDAYRLIREHGFQATKLIADVTARRQAGIADEQIRRNGNTRNSKVLKKSGKCSLYISPYVRDLVRRNRSVFNILAGMYGTTKLAFTNGLEHFIYKSEASEESVPVVDCQLFEAFGDPTSTNNPFHYNCFVVGGSNPSTTFNKHDQSENIGSFSILENFDLHFEDIKTIIGQYGRHPIAKQKPHLETTLLEDFNLKGVNDELRKLHHERILGGKIPINSPMGEFKPLQWVKLDTKPGDVIVFDCRLPYMTAKNKNGPPTVYIPVSLRPVAASWYGTAKHHELMASVREGTVGNWAKRIFKSCNLEEFAWRSGLNASLPKSSLQSSTDLASFSDQDNKIFGLVEYQF
jgi:hypothetical protein